MAYQPIENYGIVGDLHSVALVGMDGSIDMMSFPYFDSPTIFAALVDDRKGGRFQIAPTLGNGRHRQLYLPDTNVLLTRFLSQDGVSEVSDFMPVEQGETAHDLVRRAKTVRGVVPYRMVCDPRFDYGRAEHQTTARVLEHRRLRSTIRCRRRKNRSVSRNCSNESRKMRRVSVAKWWVLCSECSSSGHPKKIPSNWRGELRTIGG